MLTLITYRPPILVPPPQNHVEHSLESYFCISSFKGQTLSTSPATILFGALFLCQYPAKLSSFLRTSSLSWLFSWWWASFHYQTFLVNSLRVNGCIVPNNMTLKPCIMCCSSVLEMWTLCRYFFLSFVRWRMTWMTIRNRRLITSRICTASTCFARKDLMTQCRCLPSSAQVWLSQNTSPRRFFLRFLIFADYFGPFLHFAKCTLFFQSEESRVISMFCVDCMCFYAHHVESDIINVSSCVLQILPMWLACIRTCFHRTTADSCTIPTPCLHCLGQSWRGLISLS